VAGSTRLSASSVTTSTLARQPGHQDTAALAWRMMTNVSVSSVILVVLTATARSIRSFIGTYRFPIGASCFGRGSKVLKARLKISQKLSLPTSEETTVLRAQPRFGAGLVSALISDLRWWSKAKHGNELQCKSDGSTFLLIASGEERRVPHRFARDYRT
jgi:hypothetical protein